MDGGEIQCVVAVADNEEGVGEDNAHRTELVYEGRIGFPTLRPTNKLNL